VRFGQVFSKRKKIEEERRKVMEIGGYQVEVITRDSAKVGCTKVTRAEALALLAEMNSIPEAEEFQITLQQDNKDKSWVTFTVNNRRDGWISPSPLSDASYYGRPWDQKSAGFCLRRLYAEKLLQFLAQQLGYVAYKLSETSVGSTTTKQQKWAIEYSCGGHYQGRTGNKGATGEFLVRAQAQAIAEQQEREMGPGYKYWVVEVA
jgi:hypothetical protein